MGDAGVDGDRSRRRRDPVGAVRAWLADRSRQHLPDQPFRAVRAATGVVRAARKGGRTAGAAPAALLPVRPSPALCRVLPRLLATPAMPVGHLLLAAGLSLYMLSALRLDEDRKGVVSGKRGFGRVETGGGR